MATADIPQLNTETVTTFTVGVGDRVKIVRPEGFPPCVWVDKDSRYFLNGFRVMYQDIGEFVGSPNNSADAVYYKHKQSGKQIIQYISDSEEGLGLAVFYVVLQGIQVHDHASIYQGGPAYATYFSEIEEEEGA